MFRIEVIAFLFLAAAGGTHAFLATSLNTSDPDVAWILCPEQVRTNPRLPNGTEDQAPLYTAVIVAVYIGLAKYS